MPKFNIPKVIRELDLGDYAPEYAGQVIEVHVNPARGKMEEFDAIRLDLLGAYDAIRKASEDKQTDEKHLKELGGRTLSAQTALYEWLAENWSQGSDPNRHWTADELRMMEGQCLESDPRLWKFLMQRPFEMIQEYRGERRKK